MKHEKDIRFVDLVMLWWNDYKKPSIKAESTMRNYDQILHNHLLPNLDHRQMLRAVTCVDLQRVMNKFRGKNKLQISICYYILRKSCELGVQMRRIQYDPSYGLKKPEPKQQKKKDAIPEDKLRDIFASADALGYDGLLIYVLYYTGVRRNEAIGLKWSDVDFETNMIHVQRSVANTVGKPHFSTTKTPSSDRFIPMPSALREKLRPHKGLPNTLLFAHDDGTPMTALDFKKLWYRIMKGAKLDIPEKREEYATQITPHWFRHNYATVLYEADVDTAAASRILGHSCIKTTIDVYTHIKNEKLRKEGMKL